MAKCVLVVDDDRVLTEIAKHTLTAKGYEVMTAADGLEALEVLKKKPADLIMLDVQMPKMDGYSFILKKVADPAIAKIPVIVLTSMGKTEPLFKRHGVRAYLAKPLDPNLLLEKIQSLIG